MGSFHLDFTTKPLKQITAGYSLRNIDLGTMHVSIDLNEGRAMRDKLKKSEK